MDTSNQPFAACTEIEAIGEGAGAGTLGSTPARWLVAFTADTMRVSASDKCGSRSLIGASCATVSIDLQHKLEVTGEALGRRSVISETWSYAILIWATRSMKLFGQSAGVRHARHQTFLLAAVVVMLATTPGFSAHREQTAAQQSPPSIESTDAESRAAAARKKRFEEARRRLEEVASSGSQTPAGEPGQTLFISPAIVNMVMGDRQSFSAFDISGTTVTHS